MRRSDTAIKTDRLWLRQIDETDAEAIVSLRSDESVYQYFVNPVKLTIDDHRSWYDEQYKSDGNRIDWIAVEDSTGEFIGVYGAKKANVDAVEISYITKPDKKGRGYAKEAIHGILSFCEKKWCSHKAQVYIHIDNDASIRFAQATGFQKVDDKDNFMKMEKVLY